MHEGWWPGEGVIVSYPIAVSCAWVQDTLTVTVVKDTLTSIPGIYIAWNSDFLIIMQDNRLLCCIYNYIYYLCIG